MEVMIEIKEIEGYPNYLIYSDGRIWSKINEKFLKTEGKDYIQVYLSDGVNPKYKLVHRLLAEAFIPNPENKPFINHIDGKPANNSLDNLEWVTASENTQHAYSLGLATRRCPVQQICLKTNDVVNEFISAIEAETKTGICYQHIGKVCKGKRKSAGKFGWRYAKS